MQLCTETALDNVYACVHQLISQEFITEFIAKSWQKLIDFQALQKLDTGVK